MKYRTIFLFTLLVTFFSLFSTTHAAPLAQAIPKPITFTRTLKLGSIGADVKALQVFLNKDPATQIAKSGPGSPGKETLTFGRLTHLAVIKFQNKYKREVLTPSRLTRGTGLVGVATRTKLNALVKVSVSGSLTGTPSGSPTDSPVSVSVVPTVALGGEGSTSAESGSNVTPPSAAANQNAANTNNPAGDVNRGDYASSNATLPTVTNYQAVYASSGGGSNSPVGLNLAGFDYWSRDLPFKNVFKQAMSWQIRDSTTSKILPFDTSLFDADGWPISLPPNRYLTIGMLQGAGGNYQSGKYVALYEGAATLDFGWDARNVQKPDPSVNRYTFDVPSPTGAGIWLIVKNMTQPIRNIRIMPLEFENNEASNPWHPLFLTNVSNFGAIRLMGWMKASEAPAAGEGTSRGATPTTITLSSNASSVDGFYNGMVILESTKWDRRFITSYNGTTKVATVSAPWTGSPSSSSYYIKRFSQKEWSDRATGTNIKQDGEAGMSVELMVDLSNRLNISPWFSMYTAASDDYVRKFATYVRDNLNPNIKVYLEWSNETWNNGYPGYHFSQAKAAEMGINGWRYHAYRAVQISKIWDDVFGEPHLRKDRASSRIVRILASQNANTDNGVQIMDFDGTGVNPSYYATHPADSNPFDKKPDGTGNYKAADYADALTVTSYWGEKITGSQVNSLSVDQLIDLLEQEIPPVLDPAQMKALRDGKLPLSMPSLTKARLINIQNARDRGLDTVIYESGPSVVTKAEGQYRYLEGKAKSATLNTIQLPFFYEGNPNSSAGIYNGWVVNITSGPGAGQWKRITSYSGKILTAAGALDAAKSFVLSVDSNWGVVPTTESSYLVQTFEHFKQDALNRSPRMRDLTVRNLNAWKAIGLDDNNKGARLWNAFAYIHQYNYWGAWGLLESYNQDPRTSPKLQGYMDFIANNKQWWNGLPQPKRNIPVPPVASTSTPLTPPLPPVPPTLPTPLPADPLPPTPPTPPTPPVSPGLVAHYPFDGNANDTSGNGNNGTLINSPTFVAGKIGQAISFNGTSSYVSLASTPSLKPTTYFTLSAWVKKSAANSYGALFNNSGCQNDSWHIDLAGNNRLNLASWKPSVNLSSTVAITDTLWHHVAVVKNGDTGTNISFYVDGKAAGTGSAGAIIPGISPKMIGQACTWNYFSGSIDDMKFYNTALSASEIQQLAQ